MGYSACIGSILSQADLGSSLRSAHFPQIKVPEEASLAWMGLPSTLYPCPPHRGYRGLAGSGGAVEGPSPWPWVLCMYSLAWDLLTSGPEREIAFKPKGP